MVCRVLGDAVTGTQIPNLIAPLKTAEQPGEEKNTKWKRLFNAVAAAQNRQGDGRPLLRLVGEIMQPVRFGSTEEFESHRVALNERLLLSGLQVREDGKVARAQQARTLAEAQQRADALRDELTRRGVHPPEPSDSHAEIDDWMGRAMPDLQPVLQRVDATIREVLGDDLQYALKWKKAYYGLPDQGWVIELVAYDVSVNVVFHGGTDFESPPPEGSGRSRYIKLRTVEDAERPELRSWIEQAAKVPGWT